MEATPRPGTGPLDRNRGRPKPRLPPCPQPWARAPGQARGSPALAPGPRRRSRGQRPVPARHARALVPRAGAERGLRSRPPSGFCRVLRSSFGYPFPVVFGLRTARRGLVSPTRPWVSTYLVGPKPLPCRAPSIVSGLGDTQAFVDQAQHGVGRILYEHGHLYHLPPVEGRKDEVDVLPPSGRPAEADPHAVEVGGPKRLNHRIQAVVPRGAPSTLHPKRPKGQVDLVVTGNDPFHGNPSLPSERGDRRTAHVHEGAGKREQHRDVRMPSLGHQQGKHPDLLEPGVQPLGKVLGHHRPDVVAGPSVFLPRVAEPGHQPGVGQGLALFGLAALLRGLRAFGSLGGRSLGGRSLLLDLGRDLLLDPQDLWRHHGDDDLVGRREKRHVVGKMEVAHFQRLVDPERRDVGVDGGGDVLREALEVEVPQVVLDHAALLDSVGIATQMHWHLHADPLVALDPEEVNVDELAPDVIPLNLARHRQEVVRIHPHVDQDVHPRVGVQEMKQLLGIDAHVERLDAMAIDNGGYPAARPDLPSGSLAGVGTGVPLQPAFHGFLPDRASRRGSNLLRSSAADYRLYRGRSALAFYGWFSPWKISETDSSSNTACSAEATMGAIDRTVNRSPITCCFSSGTGRVLVTTTCLIGASTRVWTALPESTGCVAAA